MGKVNKRLSEITLLEQVYDLLILPYDSDNDIIYIIDALCRGGSARDSKTFRRC